MRLRNNIFAAAFDYLKREKGIKTQKRLAELMGVSEDTITRILKDRCEVTEDIITKLQTASGCIFNLQWLRGEDPTHMLAVDIINEPPVSQPEFPDFTQRLFDEAVRMSTRNELLERQCEKLIAELRETKDKNDAFLNELRKSKEDNDALVSELRISYEQNKALITELRETKKNNDQLSVNLKNAIDTIEGMKAQMSMMLTNFNVIREQNQLGQLRVNDAGEPVIAIQVPNVADRSGKSKMGTVPTGYIRGDIKVITEMMMEQARAAFPPQKK